MPPKSKNAAGKAPTQLFNPGSVPVVYSLTGHVLGAAEHREVPELDEVGQLAVEEGRLIDKSATGEGESTGTESTGTGESGAADQG